MSADPLFPERIDMDFDPDMAAIESMFDQPEIADPGPVNDSTDPGPHHPEITAQIRSPTVMVIPERDFILTESQQQLAESLYRKSRELASKTQSENLTP
jgi:hypothetical protein